VRSISVDWYLGPGPPAASLPLVALQRGITTVEINLDTTPLTSAVTFALPGPAGQVLPQLLQAAWPNHPIESKPHA
jgi:NAD-dependent SIR2 family protein deacetylase